MNQLRNSYYYTFYLLHESTEGGNKIGLFSFRLFNHFLEKLQPEDHLYRGLSGFGNPSYGKTK